MVVLWDVWSIYAIALYNRKKYSDIMFEEKINTVHGCNKMLGTAADRFIRAVLFFMHRPVQRKYATKVKHRSRGGRGRNLP